MDSQNPVRYRSIPATARLSCSVCCAGTVTCHIHMRHRCRSPVLCLLLYVTSCSLEKLRREGTCRVCVLGLLHRDETPGTLGPVDSNYRLVSLSYSRKTVPTHLLCATFVKYMTCLYGIVSMGRLHIYCFTQLLFKSVKETKKKHTPLPCLLYLCDCLCWHSLRICVSVGEGALAFSPRNFL